ncbi:MAG: hypothetical protein CMI96_02220 [Pelagibacteraceae bacterium]|nr:hypothetical protein [Pelagibacteraceae bacterium]|tara:strand:+ start:41627 stop:42841 length:1215 start_codon:yes stop_codon:yes gene_type:complete
MNKTPITKKEIIKFFKTRKKIIFNTELIDLKNSQGRILAENLKSKIHLPPFNNSAVDGYALRKTDLKKYKELYCCRRIVAGDTKDIKINKGEAIRIFTGAKMPSNSSTIIMQENTVISKNKVRLIKVPKYGENFRLKGEDIKKNQKLLSLGSNINQQNINLIAAAGIRKIKVFKKIKIAFFTSGNELRRPNTKLKNSEINNSNFYSLNSLLNKSYILKKYCGNLKDNFKSVKNKLLQNSNKFNIILTTGGASVGDEDHLISALSKIGKIFFWKAAIKPGRPIAVGVINKTYVICLPGNPVSVQLLYAMLISPFIKSLAGGTFKLPSSNKIHCNFNMRKKTKRMEWLRVLKKTIKNKDFAIKYPKQGSGMISSISYTSGIIEISENVSQIKKGDIYDYYNFENIF